MQSASKRPKASDAAQIPVMLLRNKKTKRILYMEAGKEFVDLLLSFLTLPTGTVLKLLSQTEAVGAINNIFDSVKQMQKTTFYVDKDVLLDQKPVCPVVSSHMNRVLAIESGKPAVTKEYTYYRCPCSAMPPAGLMRRSGSTNYVCSSCRQHSTKETKVLLFDNDCAIGADSAQGESAQGHGKSMKPGFVKKSLTYCITDDLQIRPTSTINSIALLSSLRVEAMSDLESFAATVGPKEALQLLRSSLCSKTALNDVFG